MSVHGILKPRSQRKQRTTAYQTIAATMEGLPLSLPAIAIQPSFTEVIQEVIDGVIPYERFWVSCYKNLEPSVHSKVNVELDELDRNLVSMRTVEGDMEIIKNVEGTYSVTCGTLGIPRTRIMPPLQEYRDDDRSNPTRPHGITAFSVSPDSSRFATGYMDGSILLCPTSPPTHSRSSIVPESVNITKTKVICRSHVSVVTSLKFFPSSRVILSSGQDFSLAVIPGDLPESPSYESRVAPVRVMRGHAGTVTSAAIIGIGRNVASSSLDSKVRLWDVPSGEAITTLFAKGPITSMSLGDRMLVPPDGEESIPPRPTDEREVPETSSKLAFCALKNGSFQLLDLGFKKSIYVSPPGGSPLSSIVYSSSSNLLATGSSSGVVTLYDTRSLTTPVTSFNRMKTEIEDLAFVSRNNGSGDVGLAIATSDGLPYVASIVPEGPAIFAELVGMDYDPVRHVAVRQNSNKMEVWCASEDSIVRRYLL